MSDPQETRLGQQVSEYRLVHKLGGGNFGTVYLAEHIHERTQAAVKVLDVRLTRSENFKDFINEARTIRLRHPHIVPLLDFGISRDDLPFLVMEYAQKGTLRDRHPEGQRLPLPTIISYVDQLASALQYAHDRRVIHRDVKPENLLVRANGTLMVSDFGIAKLLEQNVLMSQQKLAGTPAYMAPEQHKGYPCFASDQYSLAVVIYEWICGVRPFQGAGLGLAVHHMYTPPPPLRNHLPTLPEAVERVIIRALAKAPEDRFERIQDMATALREAAQPRTVLTPPIQISNITPPIAPEQQSRPVIGQKPEALVRESTHMESTRLEPRIQITDPYQKSAPAFHSSPPETPSKAPPLSLQKRHSSRRSSLLMAGTLGLILLLAVLGITLWPTILSILGGTPLHVASPTPTQPDQIVQKWVFPTGSYIYSSPTMVNGVLYISSEDKKVYAIDTGTGIQKWVFATDAYIDSSPTVANGVVYVGSGDHQVYAIDANTGQSIWAFPTGAYVDSSPTVADGVVYVGSGDYQVYAIDANTGLQKWTFPTGAPVASSPRVANGILYIGSQDHKIYAINANTGELKWAFLTGSSVYSSPTIANGVLYVGSQDNKVYAIDANTGKLKWAFSTSAPIKYSSPTVVNGVLYIGSHDNKVYAIDVNTGKQKWAFPTGSAVDSSPTVVNGVLYIGSQDHQVYAIDAITGSRKWAFPTSEDVHASPTVVNGVLYVGSADGKVYALTLPTSSS